MRNKLLIPLLIALFLIPTASKAATQSEIENLTFLLRQFEWDQWDEGVFNDNLLLDALPIIRQNAMDAGDDILRSKVIYAMGETGLVGFVPILIEELDFEPAIVCYALGKISSSDSVDALITGLEDEDMQVRDAAVWGLGNMVYTVEMETARDDALNALKSQLSREEESWVRDDIGAAITLIETGIIDSLIFLDLEDE